LKTILAVLLILGGFASAAEPSRVTFEDVKDKIVTVQCEDSTGSGFVCEMDGKRYFVTSKHVINGQRRVAAYFSDGKPLKFGRMEIAENADLVRFAVASNQPALKLSAVEPRKNESVTVFVGGKGKSGGVEGRVIGVAPAEMGVSVRFAQSGGALLNRNGEVLGVATCEVKDFNPEDWVKANVRFAKASPIVLRLERREWKKTDLKTYYRKVKAEEKRNMEKFGVYPQTRAAFKSPTMRINKQQSNGEVKYFVNGRIVLGLSDVKGIKNPVVRVAVLVEGGRTTVIDAVSDEPGGKYEFSGVPVYAYGMPRSNSSFNIGNKIAAYYLEGISFNQPTAKWDSIPGAGKNLEYFDRSILLSGGFRLPDDVGGSVSPKIVAFRLECWQNGSLAGVYDSMRPDTLNSKGIPVDWFVIGR
jgi:hypothetical protein